MQGGHMSVTFSFPWWLKRLLHRKKAGIPHPYGLSVGDRVSESPFGEGYITDIEDDGTVHVNDRPVYWLVRGDGFRFDPTHRRGGTCAPVRLSKTSTSQKPVTERVTS